MANSQLFKNKNTVKSHGLRKTINEAGGAAFEMTAEHALCQYVVTGTFGGTFYCRDEEEQLSRLEELCAKVRPELLAKATVYSRKVGMKDVPAYLLVYLAANGYTNLVDKVWPKVVHNGKMLANVIEILRSGRTGKKSLGSQLKRLVQNWFRDRDGDELYMASTGLGNPSLADIVRLAHVSPDDNQKKNLFAWLLGYTDKYQVRYLPPKLKAFEAFRRNLEAGVETEVPDIDWRILSNLTLTESHWKQIAKNMPWNTLRMNLNNLARHGVFTDKSVTKAVVDKLTNLELVRKHNVFPYQIMTAYQHLDDTVPESVRAALHDALDTATLNIPQLDGNTVVCVDVSGSMSCPVTGTRGSVTTKTRCVDVAALIAASLLRKNTDTKVVRFDTRATELKLNTRDSVMTNAAAIRCDGGGTDCGCALTYILGKGYPIDTIIFVSDNASWCGQAYGMASGWETIKRRNPRAKLVCIDLVPNSTVQVADTKSVLNIGSWSDKAFEVIAAFCNGNDTSFVKTVEKINLDE
jgi:60 kDa SS-A/Ro ribonucleoprotein